MKRFVCFLVLACLAVSCAFADNFDDFCTYAAVFGSTPPTKSKATNTGIYTMYTVENCLITFKEESGIFVQGDGIDFLAYCLAAIMTFESDSSKFRENSGLLLGHYMLSRGGEMKTWETVGGLTALMSPEENDYIFAVGK